MKKLAKTNVRQLMVHSLKGKARHFEMTTEHHPELGL